MGKASDIGYMGTCWVYLLMSEQGDLYVGQTKTPIRRLRSHNKAYRRGSEWSQRWRFLAVIPVVTRIKALELERVMQTDREELGRWIDSSGAQLMKLRDRLGFRAPRESQRVHISKEKARLENERRGYGSHK